MTAGLVGLSGAAIASVYALGYLNTNAADGQLTSAASSDVSLPPGPASGPPSAGSRVQQGPFDSRGDDNGREGGQRPGQSAPAATPTPSRPSGNAAPQQQTAGLRDGTFVGVGNSRHGGMQVSVIVKGGKLVSANVTGCGTRYPCSKVNPLVTEVVSRQGAPVDYVSGATDSSMAYIQAVRSALSQASSQAG